MSSACGIGVVIVTFNTDPAMLRSTLSALLASVGVGPESGTPLVEIVVVENASDDGGASVDELVSALDDRRVRVVMLSTNTGFTGGVNRGVVALDPKCSLVYLCNPDATVEPDVLGACASVLESSDVKVVSVAPKMVLVRPRSDSSDGQGRVLDSVGHAINAKGEAFNVGLGQPDLGQYDRPEACFGPCFGAAMVRRSAFDHAAVGPLDETLFLYYEDVDWNWRAQLLGFDSVTVPHVVVGHLMSASMRDRPYGDKFRYTERNLLICALKNFGWSRGIRLAVHRSAGLLKGSLTGRHYPMPGLRALAGLVRRTPHIIREHRRIGSRRVRSDAEILRFGLGERIFFDPVQYEPTERAAAEEFARARIRLRSPDPTSEAARL